MLEGLPWLIVSCIARHELRSPTQSIMNGSRLLVDSDLGAAEIAIADGVVSSCAALVGLVNTILGTNCCLCFCCTYGLPTDFEKAESDKLVLETDDVDLYRMLNVMFAKQLGDPGPIFVRIRCSFPPLTWSSARTGPTAASARRRHPATTGHRLLSCSLADAGRARAMRVLCACLRAGCRASPA